MLRKRAIRAAGIALAAASLAGFTDLLPERMAEVQKQVERVRGRRFSKPVPASEIDAAELKRVLRAKLNEALPAPGEEYFRSLSALGLTEEAPGMLDTLVDFYASQVVAFYDPQPRRFFLVKGAEDRTEVADAGDIGQNLIFSHELTHALQDETLRLDDLVKSMKDDSDRSFALQSLLEGEATLVMIRAALQAVPGADESAEDAMVPLLSAGALERANVPKEVPDYFVDQLFFPYVEGTAFVRAAVKKGGWAEVDRLWKSPPLSSSEILHGAPYPPPARNLLPSNVATLAPGHRLSYTDTLGEWTLRFLLARALPEEEAAAAAAGWRGDRIAFFTGGGKMGYLWRIRFDEPASAARFEAALKKARTKRPVLAKETILRDGADLLVAAGLSKVPELPGFRPN
ncbi:MAG: hypothetical protein WAU32_07080 [Thermoanaerobaculia bacterium]